MRIGRKGLCVIAAGAVLAGGLAPSAEGRSRSKRSKKLTPEDKLRWEAAQALYGKGLRIKRGPRGVTIAPGGLTQAKYNQYVERAYLPAMRPYMAGAANSDHRWTKNARHYKAAMFDTRAKVKRGHILLEPYFKFSLCKNISGLIGMKPSLTAAFKRISWCAYQAMQEATAPILVYKGQKIRYTSSVDRGALKITDPIFQKDKTGNYPLLVTVRGHRKLYTRSAIKILFKLTKGVDSHFAPKLHKQAQKLYKATLKASFRLNKIMARRQRKLAGRKKVIFSAERFYYFVALPPAKGPLSCGSVHYLAYGPKRSRKQGYHLSVQVNRIECQAYPMDGGSLSRNDVSLQSCGRYLKPGKNKITVAVHLSHDSFNYKRTEWRRSRLRNVTYTKTRRGRRLYGSAITCVKK